MDQAAPVALSESNMRVFVALLTIHTSLVISSNAARSPTIYAAADWGRAATPSRPR